MNDRKSTTQSLPLRVYELGLQVSHSVVDSRGNNAGEEKSQM